MFILILAGCNSNTSVPNQEDTTTQEDLCYEAVQNLKNDLGYNEESNIGYVAFDQNDGSYIIKLTILTDDHGTPQGESQTAGIYRIKNTGAYIEYQGSEIGGSQCYSGAGN